MKTDQNWQSCVFAGHKDLRHLFVFSFFHERGSFIRGHCFFFSQVRFFHSNWSCVIGKPVLCSCENKGSDQLRGKFFVFVLF